MKKSNVTITSIVFIVCGLIVVFFFGALIFKVPGLLGQLLGYIQSGLIFVGSSILGWLANILGVYFNALVKALRVTFNVVIPVLILQAAWPTLSNALSTGWKILFHFKEYKRAVYGVQKFGKHMTTRLLRLRLSELAQITKVGLRSLSGRVILRGIFNIIKSAGVMFIVSLGVELFLAHFGVPQAIDNWAHGVCPNCPNIGWSWGNAITAAGSTALSLGILAAINWWNPVGWAAGLMIAGSFILGGFIH